MAQHFRSIQKIADSTTVPSLVPHLRSRLYELDDIRRITESLNDSSLPREDRQVLFSDLARAGFARALAVAWLLPLLQLFIKVQLNVLGRHLFFETNEPGPASPAGGSEGGGEESRGALAGESRASSTQSLGRLLPAKLTLRCQQKFLSFAEYLAQCGVEAVAREALAVARVRVLSRGGGPQRAGRVASCPFWARWRERYEDKAESSCMMDREGENEIREPHQRRWPIKDVSPPASPTGDDAGR